MYKKVSLRENYFSYNFNHIKKDIDSHAIIDNLLLELNEKSIEDSIQTFITWIDGLMSFENFNQIKDYLENRLTKLNNYFVCIEDKDHTSDNYSSFKTTFDGLLKLRADLFENYHDFIDLKLKIHEITSSKALLNFEVLSALKKINDIKEIEIIKKDYMYLFEDTYPFFKEAFNNFGTESEECIASLSESLSKLCEFKQKLNIKDINYEKLDKLIDVFKCHFNESCTEYEFNNCIAEYQNHVDTINPIDHTLLSIENKKEWYKKFKSQFETLNKYNRQLTTFNCSSQELTSLINNYRSFLNYFQDEIFSCCDNSFDILNSFCDFFGNLFDGMAIFLDECTPKNKRYEYNYQIVSGEVRIKKIFTN